ncbi:MAG: PHP domain-containing protein [bacterium]
MMLRLFRTDLHVHTCLSPCGELEMSPVRIVEGCRERGIDVIAVCDHNSAENVKGVRDAAEGINLTVLAGMEVTTAEEVHVLSIFDSVEQAMRLQNEVYARLLPGENDEDVFGLQVVANASDEVEGIVKKLLIGSTTFVLSELVERIHDLEGIAIASHIDRESFSLIGQLGFIPDDLDVDALEISLRGLAEEIRSRISGSDRFPFITSSDAHRLEELGRASTTFLLEEGTVGEIRKGLRGENGRRIVERGVSA